MAAKKAARSAPSKRTAKKTLAKKPAPQKAAGKQAAPRKAVKKAAPKKFGPMGTAGKAEGNAPVKVYISQLAPDWREIAQQLDDIIAKEVPDVKRAVKWSAPFYGVAGQGWFCSFGAFSKHCAVVFFRGKDLKPVPPEGSGKEARRVIYRTKADVDAKQLRSWVKQAASMPGWGGG